MKIKRLRLLVLLPILLLGVVACDDSNDSIDYENKIIGKWQLVEQGYDESSLKAVENGVVVEYLPNGNVVEQYFNEGSARENFTYTIDSKTLYYHLIYTEGQPIDTWTYEYKFHNKYLMTKLIQGLIDDSMGAPWVKIYKLIN
ncbi:hypothetical protein D0T50_05260 [Bacteroides sp. 214]|uniref:lipocalin family protein n=1 Tax=Bacteroides sp. 214 TaxID=2302935 RepID=UPI0013D52151|nr:lipocalin family protein [Bacteroides sp. 214]NDW12297.1 hypothetical protein [Bacteroides sp. 214]